MRGKSQFNVAANLAPRLSGSVVRPETEWRKFVATLASLSTHPGAPRLDHKHRSRSAGNLPVDALSAGLRTWSAERLDLVAVH
jgi:hypothetical protein